MSAASPLSLCMCSCCCCVADGTRVQVWDCNGTPGESGTARHMVCLRTDLSAGRLSMQSPAFRCWAQAVHQRTHSSKQAVNHACTAVQLSTCCNHQQQPVCRVGSVNSHPGNWVTNTTSYSHCRAILCCSSVSAAKVCSACAVQLNSGSMTLKGASTLSSRRTRSLI
jgi:hypothetical protein